MSRLKEHPALPKTTRGPAPTLTTLHAVELILRKADSRGEGPLSLAEIKRRMKAKSVRHSTIRTCVDELQRLGFVLYSPRRGVMWTYNPDPAFWAKKGFIELR
jgi:DNA-binding IclR family transcriptional regulator